MPPALHCSVGRAVMYLIIDVKSQKRKLSYLYITVITRLGQFFKKILKLLECHDNATKLLHSYTNVVIAVINHPNPSKQPSFNDPHQF